MDVPFVRFPIKLYERLGSSLVSDLYQRTGFCQVGIPDVSDTTLLHVRTIDGMRHGAETQAMGSFVDLRRIDTVLMPEYYENPTESDEMPTQEARLAKVESHTGAMVKFGIPVLVAFMSFLGIQVYNFNGRLSTIEGQISQIPARVAQKLVEQSKEAVSAGKVSNAVSDIQTATTFITSARRSKVKIEPGYFQDVAHQLQALSSTPQLADAVHTAKLELAGYRSTLQDSRPPTFDQENSPKALTTVVDVNSQEYIDIVEKGHRAVVLQSPNMEFALMDSPRSLSRDIEVKNFFILGDAEGANQTLDGIHWKNVTFENMRIKYQGGEVELKNVRFVNCTFDFVSGPNGSRLVDYALLNNPNPLTIG
jgi:hypothetical protein